LLGSRRCMKKSRSVCSMVNLLGLVLVVQSVGSLRDDVLVELDEDTRRDNSTAGLVHINHHLADVLDEPDELTRRTRFAQSSSCDQTLVEMIPSIPCDTLKEVIQLIHKDLTKQGGQAAFEVVTLGVLTAINELAEVGSLLNQATAANKSIPAMMTVTHMLDNKIQAGYSHAQQKLMWKCCGCHEPEMTV